MFRDRDGSHDETDSYAALVQERLGLAAENISTHIFRYADASVWAGVVDTIPQSACIAVTSARAIRSWVEFASAAGPCAIPAGLRQITLFVVGRGTADRLRAAIPFLFVREPLAVDILGEESGSAAALALQVAAWHRAQPMEEQRKPVMFLSGSSRLDSFAKGLAEFSIPVSEHCIYTAEEEQSPDLPPLCDADGICRRPVQAAVFFSPSSVRSAAPAMQRMLAAPAVRRMPLVAIGPTTAREMENRGLPVAGVSPAPHAEALVGLLQQLVGDDNHP